MTYAMETKTVESQIRIGAILALVFCTAIVADDAPISPPVTFGAAQATWQQKRDTAEFQRYADEFTQFNNHFHLDE